MQSLLVIRPELEPPRGRDFWTYPQKDGAAPVYPMVTVSSVFFGHPKLWMQRHLKDAILDGEKIVIPRDGSYHNTYQFQLFHIERVAHAFFGNGIINIHTFENSLLIVKCIASNYRMV